MVNFDLEKSHSELVSSFRITKSSERRIFHGQDGLRLTEAHSEWTQKKSVQ